MKLQPRLGTTPVRVLKAKPLPVTKTTNALRNVKALGYLAFGIWLLVTILK